MTLIKYDYCGEGEDFHYTEWYYLIENGNYTLSIRLLSRYMNKDKAYTQLKLKELDEVTTRRLCRELKCNSDELQDAIGFLIMNQFLRPRLGKYHYSSMVYKTWFDYLDYPRIIKDFVTSYHQKNPKK